MIFLGDVLTIEEKVLSLSSKTMDVAINNSKRSDRFEEKQQLSNYVQCTRSCHVDSGGAYGSAVFGGKGVMSMGKLVHF